VSGDVDGEEKEKETGPFLLENPPNMAEGEVSRWKK
jgi:hypothetical protein